MAHERDNLTAWHGSMENCLDKNGKKSIYNCENYKYLLDAPFKISGKVLLPHEKSAAGQI